MANNTFGIDLGTNNIKIYSRNDDSIMVEKNMIAIENKKIVGLSTINNSIKSDNIKDKRCYVWSAK